MKQNRRKKKNDRPVIRILLLGLVTLSICMLVCLSHVVNVQKCFMHMKTAETRNNISDASRFIDDQTTNTLEIVQQAAALMTADGRAMTDDNIFSILERYSIMETFSEVYYIDAENTIYQPGSVKRLLADAEIREQLEAGVSKVYVDNVETGDGYRGCVFYMVPVNRGYAHFGELVAVQEIGDLLQSSSFQTLGEEGDVYLIGAKGSVYAKKEKNHALTEESPVEVFFNYLRSRAGDSYAAGNISDVARNMHRKQYQKTSFVDKDSINNYLEIEAIPVVNNFYLAVVYPETIYSEDVQPIIFRTLLTCLTIIFMMFVMFLYIWGTTKHSNDMISVLAYEDTITGGKNDNYFRDVAARVIWENSNIPYLVVRFDISNFRYINEAYGHARADGLLKIVVEESEKIFNGIEICTRMNADQFVLLARNDQEFEAKCEDMIQSINERAREDLAIMFPIRLKRGIYPVRKDDTDVNIIIDRANAARKSLNGDEKTMVAMYSDKIVNQMYKVDQIESEMEAAIKNKEFQVFIQPKWDIVHDRIYGGEALVRWIKADGTRIFPDEFIPVFEKNGFVEKLDLYMLEEVCKRLRVLIDSGFSIFPISVNQSRLLLHNPNYVDQIKKILKRYRIPNGYIELEITETVFQDERETMITTMNLLKQQDVQLSMDDFGSGYSSLNMLKDVPFDVIKIDREFFSESITSNSSILILRKIIEMAEGLGIRVLCEGVETKEQVELLKQLGCCYVQGYYYAKPMPMEEFITTYCKSIPDGKKYYDDLYEAEAVQREEKLLKEAESVKTQSVFSAVEKFKKNYVEKPVQERKMPQTKGPRLSTEEQKVLMREERKRKSKDAGKD